jgi:hypothetical protein
MRCREQLNVGAYLHVIANDNISYVERDEAPIRKGARTDVRLVAVVAAERGANHRSLANASEQFAKNSVTAGMVVASGRIEGVGQDGRSIALAPKHRIIGDILLADEHALAVSALVEFKSRVRH